MAYRSRVVFSGTPPAGDLLLGFRGPQVAFGLVAGRGDGGVGQEPQHVGFAVAQAFQQRPGGGLLALRAGDAADPGQPDGDAVAEQLQVLRGHLGGNGSIPWPRAMLAAWMRARRASAVWPGQIASTVQLGGVFKIAEQVLAAQLVADPVEGVVVLVPVVHDDGAVQVAVDEVLEGGQVPVAEEVIGEQARARDLQVLLAGLRPGANTTGIVAADDAGREDQRTDRRVRRRDRLRGAAQQRVHPPVARGKLGVDSRMPAQRSTGTWCMTSRNTHHAWKFRP